MPNQQNYGKIAQNFFSSLRYSPFLPKVDFDDVNIRSLWTKSCCVTIQMKPFFVLSLWSITWKLLSSTFLRYWLFSFSLLIKLFKLWKPCKQNSVVWPVWPFFEFLSKLLVWSFKRNIFGINCLLLRCLF